VSETVVGKARRSGRQPGRGGKTPAWQTELAAIQREIDRDCGNPAPYLRAAEVLHRHGKVRQAVSYLEDAVELAPDDPGIRDRYERLGRADGS
jgi:hypothetical protein